MDERLQFVARRLAGEAHGGTLLSAPIRQTPIPVAKVAS